jgi:hypothetical protein
MYINAQILQATTTFQKLRVNIILIRLVGNHLLINAKAVLENDLSNSDCCPVSVGGLLIFIFLVSFAESAQHEYVVSTTTQCVTESKFFEPMSCCVFTWSDPSIVIYVDCNNEV